MKNFLINMKNWIKNHKIWTTVIVLALILIVLIATRGPKEVKRDVVVVSKTSVIQEVEVTGRVEAAKQVDLGVQSGGKITSISVVIGQSVGSGQVLLRINTADLQVRLARQKADLEKAKIVLAKAEPKTNASDDLVKAYDDAFNTVTNTFSDLPEIINVLEDVLYKSYLSNSNLHNSYPKTALEFRDEAEKQYFLAKRTHEDLVKEYRNVTRQSDTDSIDSLVTKTYDVTVVISNSLKSMNDFVDFVANRTDDSSFSTLLAEDQATLGTFTTQINDHLVALLSIQDDIKDLRDGVTDEDFDLDSIRIDIRQAELDIQDTEVQINNRTIFAPINGVVTDVKVEVGETISSGESVISLISSNQFQIEANLPESEIAKVKLGADAQVVLDAYGSDMPFAAKVVSIDPAGTLIDGVATYKTTLQFVERDERIKVGMTADVTIKGERRDDVLAIPQRAIVTRDEVKYVQILDGQDVVERKVKTGLRGTDGNIEIISGLREGEKVIVFTEEN